jgi:hypothetical protein
MFIIVIYCYWITFQGILDVTKCIVVGSDSLIIYSTMKGSKFQIRTIKSTGIPAYSFFLSFPK